MFWCFRYAAYPNTSELGPVRVVPARWRLILFLAGAGSLLLYGYFVFRLATGEYETSYPPFMLASLSVIAGVFLGHDILRRGHLPRLRRLPWGELLFLSTVGLGFALSNARDLTSWYYSAIGDEYEFFQHALAIAQDKSVVNLFSQQGAYGKFPVVSSAYQAWVMAVFGMDNFGGKMSSVLAIVAVFLPFYFLTKRLFSRKAAVLATLFLASSHYLFAYAHTGYDNIYALFPTVLAFALFFYGAAHSSAGMLFASGVAAGLGFYTYYSSRAAIVILLAHLIVNRRPLRNASAAALVLLGFFVAVAPLVAVSKEKVLAQMFAESTMGYAISPAEGLVSRLQSNAIYSVLAFNHNPGSLHHYVSGSLLDPIVAVLAWLGLAFSMSRWAQTPHRFVLIWWAIALAATGLASPYRGVPISREHFVLPPMVAFAGMAADKTWNALRGTWPGRVGTAASYGLSAVVVVAVIPLNVNRFWEETPRRFPVSVEAVAIRAALSPECQERDSRTVIVAGSPEVVLAPALASYRLGEKRPIVLSYEQAASEISHASGSCIVLAEPEEPAAKQVLTSLLQRFPGKAVTPVYDISGLRRVLLLD